MSLNETALACLNRNRLLYLNMLEVLRRGSAELLWAGEGGVLLYDRGSGAYMLTARDRAALDGMLPLLPAGIFQYSLTGRFPDFHFRLSFHSCGLLFCLCLLAGCLSCFLSLLTGNSV